MYGTMLRIIKEMDEKEFLEKDLEEKVESQMGNYEENKDFFEDAFKALCFNKVIENTGNGLYKRI